MKKITILMSILTIIFMAGFYPMIASAEDDLKVEEEEFLKNLSVDSPADARNAYLSEKAKVIDSHLTKSVQDRKMTGEEMRELCDLVEDYNDEYEEAVEIYGDAVEDSLAPQIKKAVTIYQSAIFFNGARNQGEMKRLLAEVTGKDILEIGTSFCSWGLILLIVVFVVGVLLIFFAISIGDGSLTGDSYAVSVILFSLGIILVAVSVVTIFLGLIGL